MRFLWWDGGLVPTRMLVKGDARVFDPPPTA